MKSDIRLKRDIEAERGFDPKVNAARMGVRVIEDAASAAWAAPGVTEVIAHVKIFVTTSGIHT